MLGLIILVFWGENMKRISILVPDEIMATGGTAHSLRSSAHVVDAGAIKKALEGNDYYESWHFPEGTVEILAIEDVPNGED
jgi:hypothetical protein